MTNQEKMLDEMLRAAGIIRQNSNTLRRSLGETRDIRNCVAFDALIAINRTAEDIDRRMSEIIDETDVLGWSGDDV